MSMTQIRSQMTLGHRQLTDVHIRGLHIGDEVTIIKLVYFGSKILAIKIYFLLVINCTVELALKNTSMGKTECKMVNIANKDPSSQIR